MARNYETICEHLRQAGEQKLLKISNSFQEHQAWLKQAFEDARAQLSLQKQPAAAKPGRARDASEKENAPGPAPRRTGRKRGAPVSALETVAEDAELQHEETQHHEAKAPGVPAQEVSVAADGAGQGKPPLSGRPRRGKTAKTAPPADATDDMHEDEEPRAETKAAEAGVAEASAEEPAAAARPGRRVTRRAAAESGRQPAQAPPPQRQTRRAAAAQAAAAIAADAGIEAKSATAGDDTAAETAAADPPADAENALHSSDEDQPAAEEAVDHSTAPAPAETAVDPTKKRRGKQLKAKPQLQDTDAVVTEDKEMAPGDAEQGLAGSLCPQQANLASGHSAEDASATPTQSKQPAAAPPRTTRTMAAVERATQSKPGPQNSALKQSEDGVGEAERGEEEASPSTVQPEPHQEADKDAQTEATPRAVEGTPDPERAVGTVARPRRGVAAAAEGSTAPRRAPATAARPKRAAAAAAQRAIAATAVKRQRGRQASTASLASLPGTVSRTRLAIATKEIAAAHPAEVPITLEAAELQPAHGPGEAHGREQEQGGAAHSELMLQQEAHAASEAADVSQPGNGLPAASDAGDGPQADRQSTGAYLPAQPQESHELAEGSAGEADEPIAVPQQATETAELAGKARLVGTDPADDNNADIEVDVEEEEEEEFQEAEDVFETPSQQPRFMTPGSSFGTARQQPTAYKTGQEHLTGAQASTGRPVFVRPELPRRAELKDGPLARAAANAAAAAAQRPAMPAAAQPASRTQEADGQPGNVGRLKQEYEERAAVGSSAALPAHKESGEADEDVPLTAASQAAEGPPEEAADAKGSGQAQTGMAGMGANLVSTVRSFLPFVSKAGDAQPQPAAGKKPVKVKALEAADAARKKEAQKAAERAAQRQQVEAQKAERAKRAQDAKADQAEREEEARRLAQEALKRREDEAAARRHAKEEAEKKEREDRQKRQEELRQKRKQAELERAAQEERARKAAHEEEERKRKAARQQEMEARRPRLQGLSAQSAQPKQAPTAGSAPPAQAAPEAVRKPEAQHTLPSTSARLLAAESAADLASRPATAMPIHGVVKPATPVAEIAKSSGQASAPAAQAGQPGRPDSEHFQSYELSPYKSGSESESEDDAERRKKPIPKWARGPALAQALVAQMAVDPDEIFKLHQKTCPLNEVFSDRGAGEKHPRKDLNRRTSSGNWIEDRVTWKEELNYKKAMGYL